MKRFLLDIHYRSLAKLIALFRQTFNTHPATSTVFRETAVLTPKIYNYNAFLIEDHQLHANHTVLRSAHSLVVFDVETDVQTVFTSCKNRFVEYSSAVLFQ